MTNPTPARPEPTLSIVRENLLTKPRYTPYCGSERDCCGSWPRTYFNGTQFQCRPCGWQSNFEPEFIEQYKAAQAELVKP